MKSKAHSRQAVSLSATSCYMQEWQRLTQARAKVRKLTSFKQQVVVDKGWGPLSLIGVEPPAFFLVLLTYFSNLFVVLNLHTRVLFQCNSPHFSSFTPARI